MFKILNKEFRLTCIFLTYLFLAFTLMTFIPSYPILVSAFFICMGIFYSFQSAREANDMLYTSLLPITKRDVVKAKFIFVLAIEIVAFILYSIFTILYITGLGKSSPYSEAVLMRPNFAFLGYVLICFFSFNAIFVSGYFKTGYYLGKPFAVFSIVVFLIIAICESLHFFPTLSFLNSILPSDLAKQSIILIIGVVVFTLGTFISYKKSADHFEKIDI